MSSRYLVATGNWSDTAVWSTSYGGAGGASVPTSTDDVYFQHPTTTHTVTMTGDVTVNSISGDDTFHSGNIVVGSNTLTLLGTPNLRFMGMDLTNSTLILKQGAFILMGTPTISNTKIILYCPSGTTRYLPYSGSTLDVICYLGDGGAGSSTLEVQGSPTFRLLDIRSVNSATHTVNFQAGSTTTLTNLNVSSFSSNPIKLYSGTSGTKYNLSKSSGTVNVQYVDIKDSNATGGATWNAIDSVDSGNNLGWNFSITPPVTSSGMLVQQNGRFIKANGKLLKI